MASNVYLQQRFSALVWFCLDNDLIRSATFYAERFYTVDTEYHDARHLLATAYLRAGQTHSALHLVNAPDDAACAACHEMRAKCCTILGRFSTAREAYELARTLGGESLSGGPRVRAVAYAPQGRVAPAYAKPRASQTRRCSISRLERPR